MRYLHIVALSTGAYLWIASTASAAITPSGGGLTLVQQGPTGNPVPSNLAILFGSPFSDGALQPAGQHDTPKLNDGVYGNSNSWISDADPDGWAGISFASSQSLAAIAFGRDNLGTFTDRTLGTYTLEYRNDGLIDNTPGNWTSIGTIGYTSFVGGGGGLIINPTPGLEEFPSRRHAFNMNAVSATAVRILVPGGAEDTAIDEIELYSSTLSPVPAPTPNGTIAWNGNDGNFFDGVAPNNLALATNGSTAFSDGDLGSGHITANLNNGQYGNNQSWISDGDATSFAGIDLPGTGLYNLTSVAWGRDNRDTGDNFAGINGDRSLGDYTLQYTLVANADASTASTGDPLTGWADVGVLRYASNLDNALGGQFSAHLRHEYQIGAIGGGPLQARGLRLLMSNNDVAIDEFEIYGALVPEPSSLWIAALGGVGLFGVRRRK